MGVFFLTYVQLPPVGTRRLSSLKPFPSKNVWHWAPYRATTPNIICRSQSPRNRARILGKVHKGLKASSQETVISETETPWLWSQAMSQSVLRECKRHDGIA